MNDEGIRIFCKDVLYQIHNFKTNFRKKNIFFSMLNVLKCKKIFSVVVARKKE